MALRAHGLNAVANGRTPGQTRVIVSHGQLKVRELGCGLVLYVVIVFEVGTLLEGDPKAPQRFRARITLEGVSHAAVSVQR